MDSNHQPADEQPGKDADAEKHHLATVTRLTPRSAPGAAERGENATITPLRSA
jgi:hypothetical protein